MKLKDDQLLETISGLHLLKIHSCNLTNISDNLFYGLRVLTPLSLCSLFQFPAHALAGLPNLVSLSLGNKPFTAMGEHSLHMSNLTFQDLSFTALQTIHALTFYNCSKLRILDLRFTKLSSITPEMFNGLHQLMGLSLSNIPMPINDVRYIYIFSMFSMLSEMSCMVQDIKCISDNENISVFFQHAVPL